MSADDFYQSNRARYLRLCLGIIILLLVVSCAPRRDEAGAPAPVIPSDWKPSLDQVQDELQDASQRNPNKSQQALNRASRAMADLVDARLFIAYVRLFESLDQAARADLFNEQKNWLANRVERAQAAITAKGGSLAPLEYSVHYRKLTEERLAELEKRLKHAKDEFSPKR